MVSQSIIRNDKLGKLSHFRVPSDGHDPSVFKVSVAGYLIGIFSMQFIYEKTRKIRYRNYREKSIIIRLAVLTQYQSVRDRLTESVPLSVGQIVRPTGLL